MNYRLRSLLCLTLITCITACASSTGLTVANSSKKEAYSELSQHIIIGEDIRVHLHDGSVVTITTTGINPKTLNGWVTGGPKGFREIPLELIAKVETIGDPAALGKTVGKVALVVLVGAVVFSAFTISSGALNGIASY
jgi:hypothetical protein